MVVAVVYCKLVGSSGSPLLAIVISSVAPAVLVRWVSMIVGVVAEEQWLRCSCCCKESSAASSSKAASVAPDGPLS